MAPDEFLAKANRSISFDEFFKTILHQCHLMIRFILIEEHVSDRILHDKSHVVPIVMSEATVLPL